MIVEQQQLTHSAGSIEEDRAADRQCEILYSYIWHNHSSHVLPRSGLLDNMKADGVKGLLCMLNDKVRLILSQELEK